MIDDTPQQSSPPEDAPARPADLVGHSRAWWARESGLSEGTLAAAERAGDLVVTRPGKRTRRITEAAFREFLRRRQSPTREEIRAEIEARADRSVARHRALMARKPKKAKKKTTRKTPRSRRG